MAQLNRSPGLQSLLSRPGHELIQQRRVSPLRVFRLAAFMAQVLEKIFNEALHRSLAFTSFLQERLELGDDLQVFWAPRSPLHLDQTIEGGASAFYSKHNHFDRMGQKLLIISRSR